MLFSIVLLLLIKFAKTHISMSYPPSRRNKNAVYYRDNNLINYNLNAPLYVNVGPDYFTFPCKGFSKGPATAEFTSNIRVTLEGTVTHGGGHCQFGISFDDRNFVVLYTVITNCLLNTMTYEFPLPSNTPSGPATVFWSWVNAIGNREYYMECADVNINNNNDNQNSVVVGKELIVANILNYPIIPEFPSPNMYSGIDLFERARPFSISRSSTPPMSNANSRPISTSSAIPTSYANSRPIYTSTSNANSRPPCCISGEMKCDKNGGYYICDNSDWVFMECAPGTSCEQHNDYIICNY
jgi:hypothetical protein